MDATTRVLIDRIVVELAQQLGANLEDGQTLNHDYRNGSDGRRPGCRCVAPLQPAFGVGN